MRLTSTDLGKLLVILEQIDQGLIEPRVGDHIGRFLRQYRSGRVLLERVLTRMNVKPRADGAISGNDVGVIECRAMLPPQVRFLGFPLGEVAETPVLSEQLGGLLNFVMWLKGPIANSAFNSLRTSVGLSLIGDYRWFPVARLTPGEAVLETSADEGQWQTSRCLKSVADDINRPPHALEYLLDYRLGPPGLKFFRSICVRRNGSELQILPSVELAKKFEYLTVVPEALNVLRTSDFSMLLVYREPWSTDWTIVRASVIEPEAAVAHSLAWADFQRELYGLDRDPSLPTAVARSLRSAGVSSTRNAEQDLTRRLLPVTREIMRSIRGTP